MQSKILSSIAFLLAIDIAQVNVAQKQIYLQRPIGVAEGIINFWQHYSEEILGSKIKICDL